MNRPLPLRLVLDTYVVLDLFHWRDPRCQWLLAPLSDGRAVAYTDPACLRELAQVLERPHLAGANSQAVFDEYMRAVRLDEETPLSPPPHLPRCRDPEDQKFIRLAWAINAQALVSRDKHLLKLARRMDQASGCRVVTPEQAITLIPQTTR